MTSILIADEHEVVRLGLRSLVGERDDWRVVAEATNGRDAVAQARRTSPDVAVIECWLPRLNGVEATRQIRGRSPGTEVIMFTANDNANTVRDFMRAGGLGYVLKSDPREILISAIRSAARRRPFVNKTQSQTLAFSSPLTPREYDVLRLIAEGCTSKSVGSLLHIGLKTVQSHRASILRKLDLDSIADLVRYAVRNSIIEA
jgi:DNA-binding NarL/FixJ family response regulator